jgi:phosphoribosyl 1,2-cyclic phosphodiesterase
VKVRFLGTGASGGTPGTGRSGRFESSALVRDDVALMIDVTRSFRHQACWVDRLDAVLLTHGHRDAIGGVAALGRWWRARGGDPIPVFAHPLTLARLESMFARLDHCRLVPVEPAQPFRCGGLVVWALEVPHAADPSFPTFAWRLARDRTAVVYASDVARLTPELERFSRGAMLLVLDGAMRGRSLFSHLRADRTLPIVCDWDVGAIRLTQIGRTAPPHERLERAVRALCPKARPAYDGLELPIPGPSTNGR